jgi:hypothetical protein
MGEWPTPGTLQGPGEYPPWPIPATYRAGKEVKDPIGADPPSMPCTRRPPPTRPGRNKPDNHDKHGKVRRTGGLFSPLRVPRLLVYRGPHGVARASILLEMKC